MLEDFVVRNTKLPESPKTTIVLLAGIKDGSGARGGGGVRSFDLKGDAPSSTGMMSWRPPTGISHIGGGNRGSMMFRRKYAGGHSQFFAPCFR